MPLLASLLASTVFAQSPPDSGALRQQIERDQRPSLPSQTTPAKPAERLDAGLWHRGGGAGREWRGQPEQHWQPGRLDGNTSIADTSGGTVIGTINTNGNTTINSTGGDITQANGTTVISNGSTTIDASNGGAKANITLNGAANNFVGPFNANGANITVVDGTGGLNLGNVTTTGYLDATTTGGDITDQPGSTITINGASTFNATNGAAKADITLNNSSNNFIGQFNADGKNITVVDGTGSLTLGNVTTTGDLTANATGDITQGGGTAITIGGKGITESLGGRVTIPSGGTNSFAGGVTIADNATRAAAKANLVNSVIPPTVVVPSPSLPNPANSPAPMITISPAAAADSSPTTNTSAGASSALGIEVKLLQAPTQLASGLVSVLLPKSLAASGTGFSFPLPADLVEKAVSGSTITATLADGTPLPGWLRFDLVSRNFIAQAVPAGAFPIQVLTTIGNEKFIIVVSERKK